jgi:5'-deoxynucleotidase YfbR-like HD superfamily hydrolase
VVSSSRKKKKDGRSKKQKTEEEEEMAALRRLLLSVGYGPDRLRRIWEESHNFVHCGRRGQFI